MNRPPDLAGVAKLLLPYRVMSGVVGVLLVVLCLVGVPLHHSHRLNEAWFPPGSTGHQAGEHISEYLGVAHGWLYFIFIVIAFLMARRAQWDAKFTLVTLASGTIPILSFWSERRATRRARAEISAGVPA